MSLGRSTLALLTLLLPGQDADTDLGKLASWFLRYRSRGIDAEKVQRLIPDQVSPPVFQSLERYLERIAAQPTAPRIKLLFEIATFRFTPDSARELKEHDERQPWVVRDRAKRALGDYAGTEPGALLIAPFAVAEGEEVRAVAVEALGTGLARHRNARARSRVELALGDPSELVRLHAASAAAAAVDPAEASRVLPLLGDRNAQVRLRILTALRGLIVRGLRDQSPVPATVFTAIAGRLLDPEPLVRIQAAEIAAAWPASMPREALLAALAAEVAARAAGAGRDRMLVPLLAAVRGMSPAPEELARHPVLGSLEGVDILARDVGRTQATFFGDKLATEHIVFVLDVSGSMNRPPGVAPDAEGRTRPPPLGKTRIGIAREQIGRYLDAVTPRHRFNLVVFGAGARALFAELVPGTPRHVQQAREFLFSSAPEGKTDLFGGILTGLDLAGLDHWDPVRSGVDSVVVVTDGIPTAGVVTHPEDICRIVTQLNRNSGIQVHVVDLGRRHAAFAAALERMARDNGGRYVRLE
jgi:Mg-chelatase subunit ChlD